MAQQYSNCLHRRCEITQHKADNYLSITNIIQARCDSYLIYLLSYHSDFTVSPDHIYYLMINYSFLTLALV